MAAKKVTIILYGADRNLWSGPKCRLSVRGFDEHGDARTLASQDLKGAVVELSLDVPFSAGQVYALLIEAARHRPAWHLLCRRDFLREELGREVERPDTILRLMLVPDSPTSADLAEGYAELVRRGSPLSNVWTLTKADYGNLDASGQMALLNIEAKLRDTYIGTSSLLSFVTGLRRIECDRLFVLVSSDLKDIVHRSRDFASAPGHGAPGDGLPSHPDSWKATLFGAGNVQLSFSAATEPWPCGSPSARNCYSVDVDIDLERGLRHVGEWLDNNVFHNDKKTDQTLVYALLYSQGILPCYTLSQAAAGASPEAAPVAATAPAKKGPKAAKKRSRRRRS